MSDDFLAKLNPEQHASVVTTEGAVRIMAGAGTGKTRALTSRYCYLTSVLGIAPRNILCVTFTNRAANEMKRRVRQMLGSDLDLGYICTFHAFCVQFLKEEIHALNFPKNFIILDTEDEKEILQRIFADMNLTMRDTTIQKAIDDVLEARKMNAASYIDDFFLLNNEQLRERFATNDRDDGIFVRYLYEQKKCFGCDFNDLINFTNYILEHDEDVRLRWQERMQYVMVDEFQDVSAKQYSIARQLSGKHGNLFIVGDPDQTIYSWRGSHTRLFLDFDKTYPSAQTIVLKTNYRSTPQILNASNQLIAHNRIRFPKTLSPVVPSGELPLYYHASDDKKESEWIASEIKKLIENDISLGDIAVLYRAHYLSRAIEECFIKNSLPYHIYSGVEFYERKEIKDIICYIRMVSSGDDVAFMRTVNLPARKIGRKRLEALKAYADSRGLSLYNALKENVATEMMSGTQAARYVDAIEYVRAKREKMRMADAVQTLLDQSGYEKYMRQQGDQERLDNAAELKRAIQEYSDGDEEGDFEDFLMRIALFTNLDNEEKSDRIKMMTIHAAKGMEFENVFICGMNEGVFPSRRICTPDDMDEERRLAYVAMTRAKSQLFLSDSEGVANDGLYKYPSRFIFDAGKENIRYVEPLDEALVEKATQYIENDEIRLGRLADLYEEGARIVHPVFGRGTIKAVNLAEGSYSILFDNLTTERSILFTTKLTAESGNL